MCFLCLADPKTGVLQIPGNEWGIFRLGLIGKIVKLEIDTLHFKVKKEAYHNTYLTGKQC